MKNKKRAQAKTKTPTHSEKKRRERKMIGGTNLLPHHAPDKEKAVHGPALVRRGVGAAGVEGGAEQGQSLAGVHDRGHGLVVVRGPGVAPEVGAGYALFWLKRVGELRWRGWMRGVGKGDVWESRDI